MTSPASTGPESRCRLVLVLPEGGDERVKALADAMQGGDVASVIIPQYGLDDASFQKFVAEVVPLVQAAGAAALVCGDSRVAGREKADGIHIIGNAAALGEAVEQFAPKLIVGGGNATERHAALEMGDANPDYLFFGKLAGDIKPEPHPKNLALAEWWAEMVEIPCIVMGGTDPDSVLAIAETGAEFAALSRAVFEHPAGAAAAVSAVNALLDEKAPRFED